MYKMINPLVNFPYYYDITNVAPLYRPLSTYNVIIPNTVLGFVQYRFVEAMSRLSISCTKESHCSYYCVAFIHQDLVKFRMNIYRNENNEHILNFIQLSSCDRYVFCHVLYMIGKELKCNISGALEFNYDEEVDLENLNNMTEYIKELISSSSARDFQIQGLQTLAGCARDIAKSEDPLAREIFGVDGIWRNIVYDAMSIYSQTDLELNLIIISTLSDVLKVPAKWDNPFINSVCKLSHEAMMSEDYHTRHEGIMLYYVNSQLIHDGVDDITEFSNKIRNMDFSNDKPLMDVIDKLLD
jgi:hypothetical protein